MAIGEKKKYKVIFEPNPMPVDQLIADTFITQLMVTVVRVGLRINRISTNGDIISKRKKHGTQED